MKHTGREKGLPRIEKARERDIALAPTSPLAERYVYDPFGVVADFDRRFHDLRRNMESMLLPSWTTLGTRPFEAINLPRLARADFCDTGDAFTVDLEMPGFERNDIDIELTPNGVNVVAKRERESKEGHEGERYLAHERAYASVRRSFNFPDEVVPDRATAKLENGVLKLSLPKKEPTPAAKSRKLKVQ